MLIIVQQGMILIGHGAGCLIIQRAMVIAAQYPDQNPLSGVSTIVFFEAPLTGFTQDHVERMTHTYPEEALAELREDSPFVIVVNNEFAVVTAGLHIVSCVTKSGVSRSDQVSPKIEP